MVDWTFRVALFACTLFSVTNAVVRRTTSATSKRSATHAGQRAVAVTPLRKGRRAVNIHTARFATALKGLKDAEQANATNYSAAYTTTLRDIKGSEFVGEIGVGTMPVPIECIGHPSLVQTETFACRSQEESRLRVVFDTGSTNIWMASDLCVEGPCAYRNRHRYNHTLSTTYQPAVNSSKLEIRFGTATLKGPRGVDNFHVGPFTIRNQAFNLIEEEIGYSFEKLALEGIVGLAFPSMTSHGEVPFFDNVIRQGLLEHNEFAFYVGDDVHDGGSIFWGGVDPQRYDGQIIMFPVTQAHYWAVDLHELRVGDDQMDVRSTKRRPHVLVEQSKAALRIPKMIVDTGTTYIAADPKVRAEISQRVPDDECEVTAKYPSLIFTLKDVSGQLHELDLPPMDYMSSSDGGQNCELSLMELAIPEKYGPGMVVGELFMRRYFTVFDRGTGEPDDARVGFARARHDATE